GARASPRRTATKAPAGSSTTSATYRSIGADSSRPMSSSDARSGRRTARQSARVSSSVTRDMLNIPAPRTDGTTSAIAAAIATPPSSAIAPAAASASDNDGDGGSNSSHEAGAPSPTTDEAVV